MPNPENIANHKRKKGDPPLPGAGRPKGSRATSTILSEMMSQDPEEFLSLDQDGKRKIQMLKKLGIGDVKDVIMYKMIQKAVSGNQRAIEWIVKQIGEDQGDKLHVAATGQLDFSAMSTDELQQFIEHTRAAIIGGSGT